MTAPASPAFHIEPLAPVDDSGLTDFYENVLVPNFPTDELEAKSGFIASVRSGGTRVLTARTAEGDLLGGAVGDWFGRSQVTLLSYLAVRPGLRGGGVGTQLMAAATDAWTAHWNPRLLVAEIEDPRYHHDTAYGDPRARLRFYERLGARFLPIPYFQPALGKSGRRVPSLMLMVFGGSAMPEHDGTVDGALVEEFLAEYFEICEGPPTTDDLPLNRLLESCRTPGGLPLVPAAELPDPRDERSVDHPRPRSTT
ncbi:GNAT family N-acetyltransferase [Actinomadura decatromicini]|uniref:GNAT family N-acetyltransferase n=1 Tax=Actinomadura decatromicini TaxID=2604572 RepID=A0A5D3F745_9ACTN|nr:GNAT family N-acetyltransferase [Actinomadura decatromicini]TYK44121.1 GNAT family N-acetyltransferase [Actinomadura decatromicini]